MTASTASGDEQTDAFEATPNWHLDSLYGFALVLTGNSDDAHDLVQDAYLRAYRFCPLYAQITNYKAGLFTLTKNLFIDHYHQRAREGSLTELEVVADDPTSPPGNPRGCAAVAAKRRSSNTM